MSIFSGIASTSFKLDTAVFRSVTARKMSFSKAEQVNSESYKNKVVFCR